jgi:hypothetical protein
MLRYSNRVAQIGVYHDDTTDYLDVSSGAALDGMRTFSAIATSQSWSTGDEVGLYIKESASIWAVWATTWDATNEYLVVTSVEASAGTLTDGASVEVTLVLTEALLLALSTTPARAQFVVESTTARTLSVNDAGKLIRCTNASAVTVTPDDALPVGFHCMIVQEGSGTVSLARDGTDTMNTGTVAIELAGQYKSAYLYQHTEGAWVVIV